MGISAQEKVVLPLYRIGKWWWIPLSFSLLSFPSSGKNESSLPSRLWNLWPRNPVLFRKAWLPTGRVWPRALDFWICCTLFAGSQSDVSGWWGWASMPVAAPRGPRAEKGDRQVLVSGWWQQTDWPVHHIMFLRGKQMLFFPCASVCPCNYEMSAKSHYMLCSLMHLGFCIEIYIPAKVIVIEKHFLILHYNQRSCQSGSCWQQKGE